MRFLAKLMMGLVITSSVLAQDIQIVGTTEHSLKVPGTNPLFNNSAQQKIKLLRVDVSKTALEQLKHRMIPRPNKTLGMSRQSNLPRSIQLGMNNVPVLNQGMQGTCVTFATTAALDAAIGSSDYISQLCQLQLGLYLEKNGYNASGWEGTWGRNLLSEIDHFGIISKENQKTHGCGGLTEYPEEGVPGPEHAMTPDQFHELSEDLLQQNNATSTPILDVYSAILDRVDTEETISHIKVALNEKDRVTFGVLLLDFDLGFVGAVGTHHATYDTWVLTPEIARDIFLRPLFGGHEMIITGYDDDAIALDSKGREHKGLFTLRNSWGDQFGDHGDFYMSYDYFKVLVLEANRIRNLNEVQLAAN